MRALASNFVAAQGVRGKLRSALVAALRVPLPPAWRKVRQRRRCPADLVKDILVAAELCKNCRVFSSVRRRTTLLFPRALAQVAALLAAAGPASMPTADYAGPEHLLARIS